MRVNNLEIIFGTGVLGFEPAETVTTILDAVEAHGITAIDTAARYGNSESYLGGSAAAKRFILSTKDGGGLNPTPTDQAHLASALPAALARLHNGSVDKYYLHCPDRRIPWADTLAGLDTLHKAGKFKRLGLSNFRPHEVDEFVAAAKAHNFILPTVYQGSYSAFARLCEEDLLPTLRKHNIAFEAYSPIAGGALAHPPAQLTSREEGRFSGPMGEVYHVMYNREPFFSALDEWEEIAKAEGVSMAELAYRWVVWHSELRGELGDAVVLGARMVSQLEDTVRGLRKGKLTERTVNDIEGIWERCRGSAYRDNYEAKLKMMEGKHQRRNE